MAEALDFRHPDQPSLESSLHAPSGSELESFIDDLNPNQVSLTEVIQSHFRFNPGRYRLIVKKNFILQCLNSMGKLLRMLISSYSI